MRFLILISVLLFVCAPMLCFSIDFASNPLKSFTDPLTTGAKTIGKYAETAKNVTVGIASRVKDVFPSPQALLDTSKQVIAGYPFELISSAINELCSEVNAVGSIVSDVQPDMDKMAFVLMTPCRNTSFPLMHSSKMWISPDFDPNKKVVILITGWSTTINETGTIYAIGKAYLCRGDVNFIALDAAAFVDTLYTWSALNTREIGKYVSKALVSLVEVIPLENIHLIGHSLGAHIAGAAGRDFSETTGNLIPRITGLDPAKPCFKQGESLSGLYRGDAQVVDVIHSNPGVLGKRDALGDIDFYPNGLDPLPSGCFSIVCAHGRSWEYYAESVYPGNENNFMAIRCSSLSALNTKKCPEKAIPMGYAAPLNKKGNYFLLVNGDIPYGKNNTVDQSKFARCGLCEKTKKS